MGQGVGVGGVSDCGGGALTLRASSPRAPPAEIDHPHYTPHRIAATSPTELRRRSAARCARAGGRAGGHACETEGDKSIVHVEHVCSGRS